MEGSRPPVISNTTPPLVMLRANTKFKYNKKLLINKETIN